MALTRPKIWDLDTNIQYFMDPITVLHQGASSANVDVGFLFNRANGLVSNVALYWSEVNQSFVTAFTANTGITNSNIAPSSYANLTVGNVLLVNGTIAINGNLGQAGQYIVSTGSGMAWTNTSFNGGTITNALTVTANVTASQYNFANGVNILSTVTNSYGNTQVAAYLPTYTGTVAASAININQSGTGNQYALTLKGASTGDQWAFTVGNTARQNNITSLNTAGSAYAPFTVNGSTFTIGTTGASATTSVSIDNTGATRLYGNLTYGAIPILENSSTTTSIGTTPTAIDTFAAATYCGAKYLVSTADVTNSQYQMAEVILTQDGTNVGMSVYGISYTGTAARMTFTANITSGTVTLWATGVSSNNTVKLARTLIPV
jgi:hypothetical protein